MGADQLRLGPTLDKASFGEQLEGLLGERARLGPVLLVQVESRAKQRHRSELGGESGC